MGIETALEWLYFAEADLDSAKILNGQRTSAWHQERLICRRDAQISKFIWERNGVSHQNPAFPRSTFGKIIPAPGAPVHPTTPRYKPDHIKRGCVPWYETSCIKA
jgi:hypothetical protein